MRAGPLALSAAIVIAGLGGTPASAQEETDDAPLQFGELSLTLLDHSIDVPAGGDLLVTYQLDGALADAELLLIDAPPSEPATNPDDAATDPDAEAPAPISVDVVVGGRMDEIADLIGRLGPDATGSAFANSIDGILLPDVRPNISVADDGSTLLRLAIGTDESPSEADRLGIDEPGLYPVLVSLRVDGTVITRHGTVLHRTGSRPEASTVSLAAIAAVDQPRTLVDDTELDALAADAARIIEFAEVTEVPLTVSIPPRVVDTLTVGTSAGAIAAQSLRDDVIQGLPAVPFDISSAVAIDRADAFVNQLTTGEEQLQAALPGVPVRRDVWLVDRPISSDAASLLRTLGVRLLAVPAGIARQMLTPLPGDLPRDRFLSIALPDGTSLPALVIDDDDSPFTTDATTSILASSSPTEWAIEHLARLRLDLEEAGDEGVDPLDGRGRLLGAPDLGPLDPRLLAELVRLDARTSLHRIVDAATFSSTVAIAELEPAPGLPDVAGPSLAERVETIEQTGLVLANASSMLDPDDLRPTEWSRLLDSLVSTAYTDDEVASVVDGVRREADRLTSSVIAPEPFSLTLTSRDGVIPLEFRNTADEALRVRVVLDSQRLQFPEGDPEIVLEPNSTTEIEVPVIARTNGTTSVEVAVTTPVGGPLTDPIRVTARVQALSGVAQLVTVTLLLLLATWWFNHWRARRRTDGSEDVDSVSA